ncbi:hypothetical protein FA15DRAFT_669833 [Coprinopsis marcescibilis]|uniref:Uncharacterized protein n=1 Tax=Coprinopsis marcescibilis TaxID=230819 RepID=A0A5C3KV27_COPMA|nr:hypothetical protein FA15DRAFT_669833 [Coprinopsis marcescibilis]
MDYMRYQYNSAPTGPNITPGTSSDTNAPEPAGIARRSRTTRRANPQSHSSHSGHSSSLAPQFQVHNPDDHEDFEEVPAYEEMDSATGVAAPGHGSSAPTPFNGSNGAVSEKARMAAHYANQAAMPGPPIPYSNAPTGPSATPYSNAPTGPSATPAPGPRVEHTISAASSSLQGVDPLANQPPAPTPSLYNVPRATETQNHTSTPIPTPFASTFHFNRTEAPIPHHSTGDSTLSSNSSPFTIISRAQNPPAAAPIPHHSTGDSTQTSNSSPFTIISRAQNGNLAPPSNPPALRHVKSTPKLRSDKGKFKMDPEPFNPLELYSRSVISHLRPGQGPTLANKTSHSSLHAELKEQEAREERMSTTSHNGGYGLESQEQRLSDVGSNEYGYGIQAAPSEKTWAGDSGGYSSQPLARNFTMSRPPPTYQESSTMCSSAAGDNKGGWRG